MESHTQVIYRVTHMGYIWDHTWVIYRITHGLYTGSHTGYIWDHTQVIYGITHRLHMGSHMDFVRDNSGLESLGVCNGWGIRKSGAEKTRAYKDVLSWRKMVLAERLS